MTQEDLAKSLKVSRGAVSMWEINQRTPDPETLQRLADFFGCSVDYLLGRTDDPHTPEQKIEAAISDDPELMAFWKELTRRQDLQLLGWSDLKIRTIPNHSFNIWLFNAKNKRRPTSYSKIE